MDPRGFPTTLPEFQRVFPDDAACARYLEQLRWPEGFACSKCGNIGMTAFNSIVGIAAHASAPTYETLYSGEWTHPIV